MSNRSRLEPQNEGNVSLRGSHNFFVFSSDEHGSDTDKLKLDERDDSVREESIDNVDSDPESFREHVVSHVNLKEPIDESSTHRPEGNGESQCVAEVMSRTGEGELTIRFRFGDPCNEDWASKLPVNIDDNQYSIFLRSETRDLTSSLLM